jgi:hypothetical protein
MSPLASAPDAPTRLRSAVEIGFIALGVLVAIGVAVLSALTGASRTSSVPQQRSSGYVRCSNTAAPGHHQQQQAPKRDQPANAPRRLIDRAFPRHGPLNAHKEGPEPTGPLRFA